MRDLKTIQKSKQFLIKLVKQKRIEHKAIHAALSATEVPNRAELTKQNYELKADIDMLNGMIQALNWTIYAEDILYNIVEEE